MTTSDQYLKYLNLAREYPSHYLPLIEKQINSFTNDRQMPLSEGVLYETNEGKGVWIEARNFLMSQKPLPPFIKHTGLCQSAADHQRDLCRNGIFGHRGSDGSSFSQRILRHCKKGAGSMAEIIGADFDIKDRNTPQMTILSLIIDDGVKDRGHRRTIFNPSYKYVGWSTGKQQEKYLTVFNITENYLQHGYGGGNALNLNNDITYHHNPRPSNASKSPRHYGSSTGTWQTPLPIKDISNNFSSSKPQWKANDFGSTINSDLSKIGHRKGKKVAQKRQNTRTFYEDGAKIMQTTTKFIYNDGSVEENIDRRTIYTD